MEQHQGNLTAKVYGIDVDVPPTIPVTVAVTVAQAGALTSDEKPIPKPISVGEALLDTGAHQCHIKTRIANALGLVRIEKKDEEPEHGLTIGL